MKTRLLSIFLLTILMFGLTGCDIVNTDSKNTKNIYHSSWKSSSGYILLIIDPEKASKIYQPQCNFYIGDEKVGACLVNFDKSNQNLEIIWSKDIGEVDKVTISNYTTNFTINDVTFSFLKNLSEK